MKYFKNVEAIDIVFWLVIIGLFGYVIFMVGATVYVDLRYRDQCIAAGYDEVLITTRFGIKCKKTEIVPIDLVETITTTTPLDQIEGISE